MEEYNNTNLRRLQLDYSAIKQQQHYVKNTDISLMTLKEQQYVIRLE